MRKILLLIAFLYGTGLATYAGGFQVNLQGVAQTGMGHVGAGLAFDASAQLFNPGGLAFTRGSFNASATAIFGRVSYLEPAPGLYTTNNEQTLSTPFSAYGHYRFQLSDDHQLAAGAAVYTPFGSRVLYADDWKGQFALRELSLRAIFIQPTVAWNYKNKFGVGGGPVVATGNVELRRAIPAQFMDGSFGEAFLSGAGTGIGFNVGAYASMLEGALTVGLSHRSKVVFNASDGMAEFNVPSSLAEFFPATTFSSELPLPATTTLGFGYRLKQRHTFALDINFVSWSAYESLDFDFVDETDRLQDSQSPRNYEDAFIFRGGWQWQALQYLTVRAGAYFDMTPVQDGYLTPETPDANKIGLSAGASYHWNRLRFDASLLWVEGMERTDVNLETNFGGTWKARAIIPGFGVTYFFEKVPEPEPATSPRL